MFYIFVIALIILAALGTITIKAALYIALVAAILPLLIVAGVIALMVLVVCFAAWLERRPRRR